MYFSLNKYPFFESIGLLFAVLGYYRPMFW